MPASRARGLRVRFSFSDGSRLGRSRGHRPSRVPGDLSGRRRRHSRPSVFVGGRWTEEFEGPSILSQGVEFILRFARTKSLLMFFATRAILKTVNSNERFDYSTFGRSLHATVILVSPRPFHDFPCVFPLFSVPFPVFLYFYVALPANMYLW